MGTFRQRATAKRHAANAEPATEIHAPTTVAPMPANKVPTTTPVRTYQTKNPGPGTYERCFFRAVPTEQSGGSQIAPLPDLLGSVPMGTAPGAEMEAWHALSYLVDAIRQCCQQGPLPMLMAHGDDVNPTCARSSKMWRMIGIVSVHVAVESTRDLLEKLVLVSRPRGQMGRLCNAIGMTLRMNIAPLALPTGAAPNVCRMEQDDRLRRPGLHENMREVKRQRQICNTGETKDKEMMMPHAAVVATCYFQIMLPPGSLNMTNDVDKIDARQL